ncbi:hypothetical protein Nepgr_009839 [Nepenthes gracilis]|uniref:Uncharacterized protein n=1 Tax=Nepenthes gracilis TaxID=150966 RepID=A0AAD3SC48_NEPGR|nr:hypothetical protein Nepgr_009839 [Nepenthes gracilis]
MTVISILIDLSSKRFRNRSKLLLLQVHHQGCSKIPLINRESIICRINQETDSAPCNNRTAADPLMNHRSSHHHLLQRVMLILNMKACNLKPLDEGLLASLARISLWRTGEKIMVVPVELNLVLSIMYNLGRVVLVWNHLINLHRTTMVLIVSRKYDAAMCELNYWGIQLNFNVVQLLPEMQLLPIC